MVIGGQHICQAMRRLYDEYVKQGWSEDSIPGSVRTVHAEVLRSDTPIQLLRLAAGDHQRLQSQSYGCTTADVVRLMGHTLMMKQKRAPSETSLSEVELFLVLQTLGLVQEDRLPAQKASSKKSAQQQLVCSYVH